MTPAPDADTWAADTSVAVPALDPNNEAFEHCRPIVEERLPALPGHAAFETYSILTRLPSSSRLDPSAAVEAIALAFSKRCWLTVEQAERLYHRLGELGIAGGAVYDALVGQAAKESNRVLLTRDRRAEPTYRLLDVPYEFVRPAR